MLLCVEHSLEKARHIGLSGGEAAIQERQTLAAAKSFDPARLVGGESGALREEVVLEVRPGNRTDKVFELPRRRLRNCREASLCLGVAVA